MKKEVQRKRRRERRVFRQMQSGPKDTIPPDEPGAATSGNDAEDTAEPTVESEKWTTHAKSLMYKIHLYFDIGNLCRFPSTCLANGGGSFLVPYIVLLFVVGGPLLFIEIGMGQFQQLGPTAVSQYVYGSKGMPLSFAAIAFTIGVYYNSVMSTWLLYLTQMLSKELPWTICDKNWGADSNCRVMNNLTNVTSNTSIELAASQYYRIYILGGDDEPIKKLGIIGTLNRNLLLASGMSWFYVYIFTCWEIQLHAKFQVIDFTIGLCPYAIMIILFLGNIIQTGALKGITFLFIPRWKDILDGNVWRNAIEQMFFSLSIGRAGLIMFGSNKKFNDRYLVKDVVLITFLDTLASLLSAMVVFSVLGSWATKLGRPVPEVVSKGTGLAFMVFPMSFQVLSFAKKFQIFSGAYLIMFYLLGLVGECAIIRTTCAYIHEVFPRTGKYKWMVAFPICSLGFIISIPLSFSKGREILELMDFFGSMPLLFFALFEDLFICWVYGIENFLNDIEFMIGSEVRIFWKIITAYITPIVLVSALIGSWSNFAPLRQTDGSKFPVWANFIGWGIAVGSIVIFIVGLIWAAVKLIKAGQSLKELWKKVPDFGPGDPTFSDAYRAFEELPLRNRKDYLRLVAGPADL